MENQDLNANNCAVIRAMLYAYHPDLFAEVMNLEKFKITPVKEGKEGWGFIVEEIADQAETPSTQYFFKIERSKISSDLQALRYHCGENGVNTDKPIPALGETEAGEQLMLTLPKTLQVPDSEVTIPKKFVGRQITLQYGLPYGSLDKKEELSTEDLSQMAETLATFHKVANAYDGGKDEIPSPKQRTESALPLAEDAKGWMDPDYVPSQLSRLAESLGIDFTGHEDTVEKQFEKIRTQFCKNAAYEPFDLGNNRRFNQITYNKLREGSFNTAEDQSFALTLCHLQQYYDFQVSVENGTYETYKTLVEEDRDPGPTGITHNDSHPGNFMFDAEGRVAIIDFGDVRKDDYYLKDIANLLLTTCYDENNQLDEEKVKSVLSAYTAINPLSREHLESALYAITIGDINRVASVINHLNEVKNGVESGHDENLTAAYENHRLIPVVDLAGYMDRISEHLNTTSRSLLAIHESIPNPMSLEEGVSMAVEELQAAGVTMAEVDAETKVEKISKELNNAQRNL